MARKSTTKSESSKPKWSFKGFINYEFTGEEIAEMLNWFDERTVDISETLVGWTDAGWKTSQSYDDVRNLYIFSATAKTTGSDLDGWILQIRHVDLHRLLCSSAYVLNVLIENGSIRAGTEEDDRFNW